MKKGFLSIEYILLVAAVVSAISVLVTSGIGIYTKNLNAIDNYKLDSFSENLQNNIYLLELNSNSKNSFEITTINEWTLKKTNKNCLNIENKQKTKTICSSYILSYNRSTITDYLKITLEHKNNTIYLYFQSK
jgi:competence protein ComGC